MVYTRCFNDSSTGNTKTRTRHLHACHYGPLDVPMDSAIECMHRICIGCLIRMLVGCDCWAGSEGERFRVAALACIVDLLVLCKLPVSLILSFCVFWESV